LIVVPILSLLIQAGLIVHVIKTGRSSLWIWHRLLPPAGPIAYVVVELLPELLAVELRDRRRLELRRIMILTAICAGARAEVEISGNVDARRGSRRTSRARPNTTRGRHLSRG